MGRQAFQGAALCTPGTGTRLTAPVRGLNAYPRRQGARLAGALRYGVNVLVARVAMVLGMVIATPVLYLPLWILMPKDAA
jgi:hypothetical protein